MSFRDTRGIKDWLLEHREISERGCWLWTLKKDGGGYGYQYVDSELLRVHRLAAHLWWGFDLEGPLDVLHTCDVRNCFNPDHLFPGTQNDNMLDMAIKGRANTKLTRDQVVEIKRMLNEGCSQAIIVRKFRAGKTTIQAIASGRTWKHVAIDPPISA